MDAGGGVMATQKTVYLSTRTMKAIEEVCKDLKTREDPNASVNSTINLLLKESPRLAQKLKTIP